MLVGLDVIGVLLHLELDALLGEKGRGKIRQDLGVRRGAGGDGQHVGLDVIGVLLHLELDALLGEKGRGKIRQDLGVRRGAGGDGQHGGIGRGGAGRGGRAATSSEPAQGNDAQTGSKRGEQGATGNGSDEVLHDGILSKDVVER